MTRILLGLAAGLLLTSAAGAEEIWQTLPRPPAMPAPVESGMAPIDDIQMYYAIYGEGEPVLLIHGALGNADDDPVFKAAVARTAADYARLSPTPAEFDALVAQMSEMWATQPDYTQDQLRAIAVPTVIFVGDHDEGIEPAHAAEMAKLIPGAKLVIMKDASHFAMWQKPDEFNATVLEFLAGK